MRYELSGRTVVITGSTGGLGTALARDLVARDANVALLDLDLAAVDAQAEALGGPRNARGWHADVRDLESLEQAVAGAAEHFGRVDVVIANAGIADEVEPLAILDPECWERTVDINLNGVWRTFKAGLPLVQQQRGHLLAVSSMGAFVHSPMHGVYTATKAGVWALCDTVRLEVRHLGVTVGSAHPTFFKTPMTDAAVVTPHAMRLWNDFRGLWAMIPIETVVEDIVRGIERRSPHVVSPRRQHVIALAPGLAQKVVERFGFPGSTVQDAVEMAERAQVGNTSPVRRS